MMKKFLITITMLVLVALYPLSAGAIPSLGVAPTNGGPYYGAYADYLDYFATSFLPGTDGFGMVPSGGYLTIWFGSNSGLTADEKELDVYLVTNSSGGNSFIFNAFPFSSFISKNQIDGYKAVSESGGNFNYYALNLGSIADGGWSAAPDTFDGGKDFYFFTGTITYSGFNTGDWMFAAVDRDGDGKYNGKEFSPKTTSSTQVPEPSTLLLLGSGLIGLGILGRKRFNRI